MAPLGVTVMELTPGTVVDAASVTSVPATEAELDGAGSTMLITTDSVSPEPSCSLPVIVHGPGLASGSIGVVTAISRLFTVVYTVLNAEAVTQPASLANITAENAEPDFRCIGPLWVMRMVMVSPGRYDELGVGEVNAAKPAAGLAEAVGATVMNTPEHARSPPRPQFQALFTPIASHRTSAAARISATGARESNQRRQPLELREFGRSPLL